ncbi:cellulose biosynthesis cyclic di-GMP-binding regulatory protein BcsB [Solibacillus sp. R5-41]|uniref:cellulose biosynthesis cyclic di-GMP-binding regulatory protein BcsB n=1 Tax=Solibacillus sp. R5-41 TaxID=2048654 RepID=UPI0012FDD128|nr:cellulose biosynthesis cyclic di-GMP-binding regulatory protein BcsB [Solibacillus sp. R5-41]
MQKRLFVLVSMMLFILVIGGESGHAQTVSIEFPVNPMVTQKKTPLTNEMIHLEGPNAETSFYYELLSDLQPGDYYAQFYINHSSILIAPSSLTVKVDGEPIQSISLAEKTSEFKVNLPKEALKAGMHSITVSFTGFLKEGICVPQHSTSNWVTIQINSFLNVEGITPTIGQSLSSYPDIYTGTPSGKIQVVIPEKASMETLNAALQVANYLTQRSAENSVHVVNEQEVRSLTNNFVLIGLQQEFSSSWAKKIVTKNELPEKGLQISQMKIVNGDAAVHALLATAKNAEEFDKIDVLTTPSIVQQLTGEKILIEEMPVVNKQVDSNKVTFKQLGMQDFTLDNRMNSTNTHFYYLPVNSKNVTDPTIELHFKYSDIIASYEELTERPDSVNFSDGKVELIVYLNGVPHAVDMQALSSKGNEDVKVSVPFEPAILKDSQVLSIQVAANGLAMQNPCVVTDQKKWIYVYDDSALSLPMATTNPSSYLTFSQFPFPFAKHDNELIIVVPDSGEVSENELLRLYGSLTTNNATPKISIVKTSDVNESQLKKSNVIFVGGPKMHPLLKKKDNLVVAYQNGVAQLTEHGFIHTSTGMFAFLQPNVWNNDYGMLVFDKMSDATSYLPKELLSFIRNTEVSSNVIVQVNTDQIFTNEQWIDEKEEQGITKTKDENDYFGWVAAFIGLMAILVLLIVFFKRKKIKG